jgi:iron complex outermembrane receptor protein
VVNVIDNRIPKEAIRSIGGVFESRAGGAERERGNSALLEAGNGVFAVHADGFQRATGDYHVPIGAGLGDRIVNSSSHSNGGAIGASLTFKDGHVGMSRAEYRTQYGTVAEPDVKIDMKQSRSTIEGEMNNFSGVVESVAVRGGQTDYQHVELESGAVGTRFTNKGHDFRLEVKHATLGLLSGVIGIQAEGFKFAALGEEAFVPATRTQNAAMFAYEEIETGAWKFSFGGRVEKSRVNSDGAAGSGIARFGGAAERSFSLSSYSGGVLYRLDANTSLTASVAQSQRGPAFYELFADGPHVATAAYELGDSALQREKSSAFDVGMQWKWGAHGKSIVRMGLFTNRFGNYIALRRSGIDRDVEGNAGVTACGDGTSAESGCTARILPEFRYQGVRAHLTGFEGELKLRLLEQPNALDWEIKADLTRAQDLTHNEPLPRIAPLRISQSLIYSDGPWVLRGELDHAARQDRVPVKDLGGATPAYTMLHAALSYSAKLPGATLLVFVKLNNIGNRLAYNASSIDTVRLLAPLPARGLKLGMQLSF